MTSLELTPLCFAQLPFEPGDLQLPLETLVAMVFTLLVLELLYLVNPLVDVLAVLDTEDRQLDLAELAVIEDALDVKPPLRTLWGEVPLAPDGDPDPGCPPYPP